jgi:hypothetical protein
LSIGCCCWLHLYHLEQTYADYETESLKWEPTISTALIVLRRYLSAIKALAMVRKLALPVLQVNIGQSQVNVASAGTDD